MCVYTCLYFFLGFLGHQGEDTFHSEPWCWLARAPCSTGTFHQTHATNSTFPVQELRLFLLLYPQLLCLSVESNKSGMWKGFCFAGASGCSPCLRVA